MQKKDLQKTILHSLRLSLGILIISLSLYFFWRGYETLRPLVEWHLLTKKEFKEWSDCNVEWMNFVLQSWKGGSNKSEIILPVGEESLSKSCGIKPNRYIWEK